MKYRRDAAVSSSFQTVSTDLSHPWLDRHSRTLTASALYVHRMYHVLLRTLITKVAMRLIHMAAYCKPTVAEP